MIKKILISLTIVFLMLTMVFAQGRGQRFPARRNLRANSYQTFDVANPVQINGSIVTITRRTLGNGMYRDGLELLILTGAKNISVRLGPVAFLESTKWNFKKGDKIEMIAYNGTGQNKGMLFAAKISMNGKTLILRDENGIAQWRYSRWGRGRRGRR